MTTDLLAGLRSPTEAAPEWAQTSPIVRFARDVARIELWPRQQEILAGLVQSTARTCVLRLGRRSGKGLMSAVLVAYEAVVGIEDHRRHARPGERLTFALVANSADQARVLMTTVRGLFEQPALTQYVERSTLDGLDLTTGATITVMPCSARTIRGRATPLVVLDEFAHAVDSDGGLMSPQAARELLDALQPGTLQFPRGRVVVTSTPRWASGAFHELAQAAADPLRPEVIGWHFATPEVNPTLSQDAIVALAADPAQFRREVLAEFAAGSGAVLDADLVRAAVRREPLVLPPRAGVVYVAALDAGFVRDATALVLGHREPSGRLVVDLVESWRGAPARPLGVDAVLDRVAEICRLYNNGRVCLDQFASQPLLQGLRRRGIAASERVWTSESKVAAATATRATLYRGDLELPGDRELVGQLIALEQTPTPSGRVRIAGVGRSDDLAHALLMLIAELAQRPAPTGAYAAAHEGAGIAERPVGGARQRFATYHPTFGLGGRFAARRFSSVSRPRR